MHPGTNDRTTLKRVLSIYIDLNFECCRPESPLVVSDITNSDNGTLRYIDAL